MKKKWIAIAAALMTLALIGAVFATSIILSGQRASNELDSYTTLNSPIRLTKVGDIPDEVYPGILYAFHVVTENLDPTESYTIQIAFEVSLEQIFLPVTDTTVSTPPTPTNTSLTPIAPPLNWTTTESQLSPDMVNLTFDGQTVNLTYNTTENSLIGYSNSFTTAVGYYESSAVTVQFNDAALSASIGTWTVSIWAVFA